MKKLLTVICLFLLFTTTVLANGATPRYAVGMVSGFYDRSRAGKLDVTSNVPTPIDYISHYFSADTVVAQDCQPGKPCVDIMRREYSPYSNTSYNLTKQELDGHTGASRAPRVEGYRNTQ